MSKIFLKMSFGMVAAVGLTLAASAAAPGARKQLHGHVPSVVSHLASTGRLNATNKLHLAIGLPLRNQDAVDSLLQQINDPASPNYHHYLTPEEFAAHFGPTEQDYQAVKDFIRAKGLTVSRADGNRMLLEVTGSASDVEKAFNVKLNKFRHPTENRDFFAPDQEPSVPVELSVLDVWGLSNYPKPRSSMRHIPSIAKKASPAPKAGSAPGGDYMGYDYRKAYVPGTTLTGTGQKVALVQFDGYFATDIAEYVRQTGLPTLSITNILLDGFDGNPTMTGGEGEVTLDIEMVNSMAPGLGQLLVYEQNPNNFNPNSVLNQIAMDNAARQVSCSWGWGGGPSATSDQIFQEMILQGQSFFNASGDTDASLPGEFDDPNGFGYPTCSPYLTQVGGTKLTTDAGGKFVSETVWNDRTPNANGGDWGSTGGISDFYKTPSWQVGFGTAANHGSTTGRNVPDVALTAINVYMVLYGQGQSSGGTSAAAPLWAGFMALVNQQAVANGHAPAGFINPAIYALAKTAAYTNCFHDVTAGDNTWPGSPTNFFAVTGYDLATGLGTPNGTNLINALTTVSSGGGGVIIPPIVSAPLPPWGTNLAVMNGSDPNGAWFLFVQDDKPLDVGMINNGWFVTLTTANPVGYAADNQVYATPASVSLGTNAHWLVSLSVTNYGPSSSTNVVVTDLLPGVGVTLLSSIPTVGPIAPGYPLVWTVGNLPINTGATLALDFLTSAPGIYTNTVSVNANTDDPNSDDDTAVALLTVANPGPPVLTPGFSLAGGFHLTVTGTGANVMTTVQASTNLVNWLSLTSAIPPFVFTDPAATNYPHRFYRAVLGP